MYRQRAQDLALTPVPVPQGGLGTDREHPDRDGAALVALQGTEDHPVATGTDLDGFVDALDPEVDPIVHGHHQVALDRPAAAR
jgi:hypothetical protein